MEAGVIVARFQVPVLIEPFKKIIELILSKHKNVWCVLGEAPTPGSKNNPLSARAREAMLKKEFSQINVIFLKDHPRDEIWSQNLDTLLHQNNVPDLAVVYGSEGGFVKRYSGKFGVEVLRAGKINKESFSPTEKPHSVDFREGRVHAFQANYPKVYPTVDIALFGKNKSEVLLGKKTIDKRWRLIGGFVDPADDSYEMAASRELLEEAGNVKTTEMVYEKSFKIDDWRYRYEEDKIISCLFSSDYLEGTATGSDDLAEVKWFSLTEIENLLNNEEIVSEHYPLIRYLIKKYSH
jgi:bifunctional NMN adenylyltransferase/nudix hydrolase